MAVTQWCARARDAALGVYALANPAAGPLSHEAKWLMDGAVNLFSSRTRNDQALAIAPRLLRLDREAPGSASIVDDFATQDPERPWCSLWSSGLSPTALATRLTRRIDVVATGKSMMLRFWDSRVLLALHQVLEPAARQDLFAVGAQALVPDRRGGFATLEMHCPAVDPLASNTLVLSGAEMRGLGEAARPDALLGMLRERNAGALETVPAEARHPLAQQQLDECRRRGLHSPRDQALALLLSIEHGPDWWSEQRWRPVVDRAAQSTLLKAYGESLELA